MRNETERWLHHAREDLETARVTLAGKRWSATSFHAQQAAEKALKALWIETKGEPPPRIHDLVPLAEEAGLPRDWTGELDVLTRVYLVTRYPDAVREGELAKLNEERARAHIELAERVITWLEQRLSTA